MGTAITRFAISGLSRQMKGDALKEEIVVDKVTGSFYIRTPEGDLISYDDQSRKNLHIAALDARSLAYGIRSSIQDVILDTVLPAKVTSAAELLPTPLVVSGASFKQLMVSVDADKLVAADLQEAYNNGSLNVKLVFSLETTTGGNKWQVTFNDTIETLAKTVFQLEGLVPTASKGLTRQLRLESLQLSATGSPVPRIVLHSVLLTFK